MTTEPLDEPIEFIPRLFEVELIVELFVDNPLTLEEEFKDVGLVDMFGIELVTDGTEVEVDETDDTELLAFDD